MSHVQLVDTPLQSPGTCVLCGVAGPCDDGRKFIDFGLQIEFYGAVVFCTECVGSIAAVAGFISSAEHEAMKLWSEGFTKEQERLKEENRILRDAMVAILDNNGSGATGVGFLPNRLEDDPEQSQTESETPGPEPDTSESSDSKESGVVHSNSRSAADGDGFF